MQTETTAIRTDGVQGDACPWQHERTSSKRVLGVDSATHESDHLGDTHDRVPRALRAPFPAAIEVWSVARVPPRHAQRNSVPSVNGLSQDCRTAHWILVRTLSSAGDRSRQARSFPHSARIQGELPAITPNQPLTKVGMAKGVRQIATSNRWIYSTRPWNSLIRLPFPVI